MCKINCFNPSEWVVAIQFQFIRMRNRDANSHFFSTFALEMNLQEFQQLYARHPQVEAITLWAATHEPNLKISGL